ncbi:uncharacterized protein LOC110623667 [Manihot esculenta]|uniref:Uncharacterized protein n=3 Tax=Manihot esculenta TaxID=3983 RepID=A0A2C9V7N2_MANES|nr:uncharacterized protein LOC110623667 [Manihot esculenta]KAG8646922.1 hypothetical protein MANES_09G042200v8 [Manihot esculenta]OAY40695.1 hypothetical protein MANES_09G042200v8 [Manihot esculenta]
MTSSIVGLGCMAAFAISAGSVILIAHQLNERLVSDFMKKVEFELMGSKRGFQAKKRVRFAEDVIEPLPENEEDCDKHLLRITEDGEALETMPVNRQILYKGILEYRTLQKGCYISA